MSNWSVQPIGTANFDSDSDQPSRQDFLTMVQAINAFLAEAPSTGANTYTGPQTLPGLATSPNHAVPRRQLPSVKYYGSTSVAVNGAEAWVPLSAAVATVGSSGSGLTGEGNLFSTFADTQGSFLVRGCLSVQCVAGTVPSEVLIRLQRGGIYGNPEFSEPFQSGSTRKVWFEFMSHSLPPNSIINVGVRMVGASASTQCFVVGVFGTHMFFPQ